MNDYVRRGFVFVCTCGMRVYVVCWGVVLRFTSFRHFCLFRKRNVSTSGRSLPRSLSTATGIHWIQRSSTRVRPYSTRVRPYSTRVRPCSTRLCPCSTWVQRTTSILLPTRLDTVYSNYRLIRSSITCTSHWTYSY